MTHDGATRPWGLGVLAFAAFVFAAFALNAVLLWEWSGTDDHPREASRVAAPEIERLAGASPSPPPSKPLSAEAASRPDGERRAAPEVEYGRRGVTPDPSPPGTAGLEAYAKRREPGAASSPGGSDSTSHSTPVAVAAASAQGSSELVPHAPDSRAGGPAVAAPDPEAKTPAEVEPGSDHTPPVLEVLRFDPPIVEGGNVTTLTVQASDDLSGVKSVRGEIRSPNRSALLPFGSGDVGSGGVSTFAITIPRQAESGVWYVSWISLTDGAANASLIQAPSAAAAPPGGTLTVNSAEPDSTPPEVLQIWFDKGAVDGGEKNVIRVEARDDSSGVTSIMGACQSSSKSALIWFTCALNAESGAWEGDVLIPRNADCGEWGVQQLAAKDKAGNTTLLMGDSPLLARAGFQVSFRAECDSTPPTLDALDLSPTIVSSETATELLVTATVYDEGSGAVTMTGWFEGPVSEGGQVPKNYFRCSPDPRDPAAPWTGKILVPQFAPKGTWKVGVIRLEDKARNFRVYTPADPVVSGRVFEVQ